MHHALHVLGPWQWVTYLTIIGKVNEAKTSQAKSKAQTKTDEENAQAFSFENTRWAKIGPRRIKYAGHNGLKKSNFILPQQNL